MTGKYELESKVKGLPHLGDRGRGAEEDGIRICREFIQRYLVKTKGARRVRTSYSYKHAVERWAKTYISNRDFIVAMFLEGYTLTPASSGMVNFWFNTTFINDTEFLFYQDGYKLMQRFESYLKAGGREELRIEV